MDDAALGSRREGAMTVRARWELVELATYKSVAGGHDTRGSGDYESFIRQIELLTYGTPEKLVAFEETCRLRENTQIST
jgi:hypothetical protein